MKLNNINNESGLVTVIALLMVGMLTLIGIAALTTSDDEVEIAGNEIHDVRAFYAAEAGLEAATAAIETSFELTGAPPAEMPKGEMHINEYGVTYATVDEGAAVAQVLSKGTLSGLDASVKTFTVTAVSQEPYSRSSVQMNMSFEAALVPVFQFSVFYENDLEIAAGTDLTDLGRIHTNSDFYVQSEANLKFTDFVTAVGDIRHGRKGPGTVETGDVTFKNYGGSDVSMKDGSEWLDADDVRWLDSSLARWGGMVQDNSHGQDDLAVPVTGGGGAHKLIERETGNVDSYEAKASLKHIDGVWYQQQGGVWQDVTAGMEAAGIVTPKSGNQFYDARQAKGVDVVDLDVNLLYASTYAPANGVIYFADAVSNGANTDFPALRLTNGTELGGALTIASENPVYTVGDFNKTNKQPAAILADALTFLSGNWNDANGKLTTKFDRVASGTEVNVSYMVGNVETTVTDYSGGFENLVGFLEDWSGKDMVWTGSAANLWTSLFATGAFDTDAFNDPTRKWAFDTDLNDPANMPPGVPTVRVFQRTGWKQEFVGFSQVHEVVKGTGNPN